MSKEELIEWLKEYRLNLMSLMGQDDYVTGKLDVIKDVLDKLNQNKEDEDVSIRKIVRCEDPMVCLRGCSVHEQTCKHPIYENQT